MVGKRGPGRKGGIQDGMTEELIENKQCGDLEKTAEDRQERTIWLPGTCRAEH